jgi:hypothetical protein
MLLSIVSAGAKITVFENVKRIYFVYVYAMCDFETIALFHRKMIFEKYFLYFWVFDAM